MILNSPMSPVLSTCVPPQSSIEKSPNGQHPHVALVFLAEQRHRARGDGIVQRHDARVRGRRCGESAAFTRSSILRSSSARSPRLRVGEIEAQAIGGDQRSFLLHMLAQHCRSAACSRWVAE